MSSSLGPSMVPASSHSRRDPSPRAPPRLDQQQQQEEQRSRFHQHFHHHRHRPVEDLDQQSAAEAEQDTPPEEGSTHTLGAEQLKKRLRFFFLDPWAKWRLTRRPPYKLIIQLIKVFVVTIQLVVFASLRQSHIEYMDNTATVLRHIFLKDWDDTRDIVVYPPPAGPYAAYTRKQMFERIAHVVMRYYTASNTSFGLFFHDTSGGVDEAGHENHTVDVCLKRYTPILKDDDPKSDILSLNTTAITECHCLNLTEAEKRSLHIGVDVPPQQADNTSLAIEEILKKRNVILHPLTMVWVKIKFDLLSIRIKSIGVPVETMDCFNIFVNVLFDNSEQSGQVVIKLNIVTKVFDASESREKCRGGGRTLNTTATYDRWGATFFIGLDAVVVLLCFASLLLCARALFCAYMLRRRTEAFFRQQLKMKLSHSDRLEFLNLWYVMIVISDVCIIIGTLLKLTTSFKDYEKEIFTATGLLLGVGTLLVWIGVLRYLGFFAKYNVLILTLKRAFPDVLRFLLCALILYTGFLLCGWMVLGPYSIKFASLEKSSEALFSLINGDDMFATFATISEENGTIKWFGRLYLYVFIALFIYVVLSLFVSILMDAYEIIKERYEGGEVSDLRNFMFEECSEECRNNTVVAPSVAESDGVFYRNGGKFGHFCRWLQKAICPHNCGQSYGKIEEDAQSDHSASGSGYGSLIS